jgi:hypothetical protein
MYQRPPLQLELKREVDLYSTGATCHSLHTAWGNYSMRWKHTPEECSKYEFILLNEYEKTLRIKIQEAKSK